MIATIIVLYRPDEETLEFIQAYAGSDTPVIAVWNNAPPPAQRVSLEDNPAVTVIRCATNIGLASALNMGIKAAFAAGARSVFLLDQDSRPARTAARDLEALHDRLERDGLRVALVGPTLKDKKAAGAVNEFRGGAADWQHVDGLSTSGSLIRRQMFEAVGQMWDALFIDCIDHEWCFRARSLGFAIVQSRAVVMAHDMGDAGITFLGRYKPIHRSPFRHFHIVRNTMWLVRLGYVPLPFRLQEAAKMVYRMPIYLLVSSARLETLRLMARGFWQGLFLPELPGQAVA